MCKYIFVTGGVVSGLGKGIVAASLGNLLKQRGLKISVQKLDPYMNIDPGTMSPLQHGEVFVTDDGAETDLDLGHYERFIDINLNKTSNLTSGKVYWNVLNREREGGYLGKTVQVIPQITDEIKEFIYSGATDSDIHIVEIGGTTGDIEGQPFLEAIRQLSLEVGTENCVFIHVTLVPYLSGSNEHKSKPTQHSVKELRSIGISPDIIIARAEKPIGQDIINKIALFCNVKPECVIENLTLDNIYEAPLMLRDRGLDNVVCDILKVTKATYCTSEWNNLPSQIQSRKGSLTIGLVGKYVELQDAYLSIVESLHHASFRDGINCKIEFIDSDQYSDSHLKQLDGILIPGGFGTRGVEGMIKACEFARTNNVPYLGICLGMQVAIIEFARNVCNLKDSTSTEFDSSSPNQVIHFIES